MSSNRLAPLPRRQSVFFLLPVLLAATVITAGTGAAQEHRWVVAFANATEEPSVTLEGTGFTGRDVRESLALTVRRYPIDLVFYDNQRNGARAAANARDAVTRNVDLYIEYLHDAVANVTVGEILHQARIPVLAVNTPVPGAPLYTADNVEAGRLAGEALGQFGAATWRAQSTVAVLVGALEATSDRIPDRAQGVREGLRRYLPQIRVVALDTQGNPAQVGPLLGRVLASQPGTKILVAAMDDSTALSAKTALEAAGRLPEAAVVSHGADRSVHGGMNDKKEIDPNSRGSVLIGSVAFFLDRYGEDLIPLALRMLQGGAVPPRTTTRHVLITAANVFRIYPPTDMN